jgi:8-oxo-dGTP pyrophosphatase MutT (NUDIX family)
MPEKNKAFEESAGTIVFRNDPEFGPCVLLLQTYRKFDLPKGHLDSGETPVDAAIRESSEECSIVVEVGHDVELDPSMPVARFLRGVSPDEPIICDNINKKNGQIKKRVYLYPVETEFATPRILPNKDGIREHQGFFWCPIDEIGAHPLHDYLKQGVLSAIDLYLTNIKINEAIVKLRSGS